MNNEDIKHIAFVLVHGGFETGNGGCSCGTCGAIRSVMYVTRKKEADEYMAAVHGVIDNA